MSCRPLQLHNSLETPQRLPDSHGPVGPQWSCAEKACPGPFAQLILTTLRIQVRRATPRTPNLALTAASRHQSAPHLPLHKLACASTVIVRLGLFLTPKSQPSLRFLYPRMAAKLRVRVSCGASYYSHAVCCFVVRNIRCREFRFRKEANLSIEMGANSCRQS